MSRTSPIARAGLRSLIFRILQALSDAMVVFVTARGLGAEGRGVYALAAFTVAMGITPLGGIATSLAAELAHRRGSPARVSASAIVIALVGGGLCALVVAAGAAIWSGEARYLLPAAAIVPFALLAVFQQGVYQAQGAITRMHLSFLGMSLAASVSLAVATTLAPGETAPALAAWAASQSIVPLIFVALDRKHHGLRLRWPRGDLVRLIKRGAPVSLGNAIIRLNYRIDLLVVAALLPLASVGRYSVAVALGEALWMVSRAVGTGAYARIISASVEESVRLSLRAFCHCCLLLAFGGGVLVLGTRFLAAPVFGSEFSELWVPTALLIPGVMGLGVSEMLRAFLLVRLERSSEYLKASAGGLVINLILAVLLVPELGIAGAAISTSVSYVVAAGYIAARFGRLGNVRSARAFVPGRAEVADYVGLARVLSRSMSRSRRDAP